METYNPTCPKCHRDGLIVDATGRGYVCCNCWYTAPLNLLPVPGVSLEGTPHATPGLTLAASGPIPDRDSPIPGPDPSPRRVIENKLGGRPIEAYTEPSPDRPEKRCTEPYDPVTIRFDQAFDTLADITERVIDVSQAFGLGVDDAKHFQIFKDFTFEIRPGDVVYITGDSGSGKSVLLRFIKGELATHAQFLSVFGEGDVNIDQARPLIDCFGKDTNEAIRILSAVGLNDAFLLIRKYSELSDGQKYRYRLARAIDAGAKTIVMDEFCSVLDRTTAKVVAYTMQKLCRRQGITLVVATAHDDLRADLNPNTFVRKGIGQKVELVCDRVPTPREVSVITDVKIEEGTIADYETLAEFHYKAGKPGGFRKVYRAVLGGDVIGVVLYTTPTLMVKGRADFIPEFTERYRRSKVDGMKWLNANCCRLARTVIHPKFRGVGLAYKLVAECNRRIGYRYIEAIAAMGRYSAYHEKAGMTAYGRNDAGVRTLTQQWDGVLADLEAWGLDVRFIKSKNRNLAWLKSLPPETQVKVGDYIAKKCSLHQAGWRTKIEQLNRADPNRHVPVRYHAQPNSKLREIDGPGAGRYSDHDLDVIAEAIREAIPPPNTFYGYENKDVPIKEAAL